MSAPPVPPEVPWTLGEYLRSFGPGIVVVLTWLGAGDVVDMAVAGSSYGYSLMWVLVVAVFMRFVFVSAIARHQLCNPHGEGVLDGLCRVHPAYAPLLFAAAVVMSHVYQSYMTVGAGEVCRNLFGRGETWQWAIAVNASALLLVLRPSYAGRELVFKLLLGLLTVSFLGSAIWVGFDPLDLLRGLFRFEMPGRHGRFDPLLVALAMVGAVGGSLMNLAYPYFLEAKGWRGPQYRRVAHYDFLLAVVVMIVLNLSVWTLGAELLHPSALVWTLPGMPDFVTLTLVANSAQVVLLPMLAVGLLRITSSARFIGVEFRNRPHENVVMLLLVALAVYGAVGSLRTILGQLTR